MNLNMAGISYFHSGFLAIFLLLISGADSCLRNYKTGGGAGDKCDGAPKINVPWQCGLCGAPIDVKLRILNDIVEPNFDETVELKGVHAQELFYLLIGAANSNKAFRFSTTYWGPELGMMVDKINNVAADWSHNRYWQVLFANGTAFNVGVSHYVPQHKDEIVFEYSVYKDSHQ